MYVYFKFVAVAVVAPLFVPEVVLCSDGEECPSLLFSAAVVVLRVCRVPKSNGCLTSGCASMPESL